MSGGHPLRQETVLVCNPPRGRHRSLPDCCTSWKAAEGHHPLMDSRSHLRRLKGEPRATREPSHQANTRTKVSAQHLVASPRPSRTFHQAHCLACGADSSTWSKVATSGMRKPPVMDHQAICRHLRTPCQMTSALDQRRRATKVRKTPTLHIVAGAPTTTTIHKRGSHSWRVSSIHRSKADAEFVDSRSYPTTTLTSAIANAVQGECKQTQ